ncbi:6008_t:CDS:2 [Ambispora leptoticha]|uniref:6008_t:CDS:1 n=1 Tax=Ambispora leptoticha TaxID=144679 RepID=A0A9N8ZC24_9GLOM|nr:6008_t:CDS:2 [Ambispora leptoticha]
MNKDHGVPSPPRSPRAPRTTSTQRKPRVTSAAKLDLTQTKPQITRSNTLPPPPVHYFAKISRNNTANGLPDKEKSRSDDGFHSDSDKDSNNSNISVHSSISHLNRTSNLLKMDPIARVRSSSSLNNLSETAKIDSLKLANVPTNRKSQSDVSANRQSQSGQQAGEARKERKIQDLEISIQSLIKLNTELDATNKQQAAEIERLKQRLEMHESYISGINATDDEDEDDNEVSTPLSDVEFLERARENDIRFRRILIVIDEMIRTGTAAIESTPKLNGSRVLSTPQIGLNQVQRTSSSRGKSTDTINTNIFNAEEELLKVELVPDDKLIKLKKSETQSEQKWNNNHHLTKDNIILNVESPPGDHRIYPEKTKETKEPYSSENELKSNLSTMNPETKIKVGESIGEQLEINKDRVRAVIDELLILAKQDHFHNKAPVTSPVKERPGLGILLHNQRGQSTHLSPSININETDDAKQNSSAVSLLYELQDLLGLTSFAESSKLTKYNRNSFPVMSSSHINFNVDPPDDKEELLDPNQKTTTSRNRRRSSKERIIRRRSSPSFSTPSSNTVNESHINNSINLIPGLARHTSWVSSLGFLTPWKAATTAAIE